MLTQENACKTTKAMVESEQGIWILKDNKPQRISIQLGAKDSEKTEIISAELQENDKVIIKSKSSSKKKTQTGRPMRMF